MKKGDLLLIHSRFDPLAWLIRKITKSYWNHVAWAIDHHYLLEARATAIKVCPITKYLNWKYKVKLIRLKSITKKQLKEAIEYASQFKRKRTYFKYLKIISKIFFYGQDTPLHGFTCSNLIARGLEKEGYYFIPSHKKSPYLVTPDDISKAKASNVSYELLKQKI